MKYKLNIIKTSMNSFRQKNFRRIIFRRMKISLWNQKALLIKTYNFKKTGIFKTEKLKKRPLLSNNGSV